MSVTVPKKRKSTKAVTQIAKRTYQLLFWALTYSEQIFIIVIYPNYILVVSLAEIETLQAPCKHPRNFKHPASTVQHRSL
jgi:hypothetical protein